MLRGRSVEDLDLLTDIADAFKHHETTYPLRRRVRQVTSAKATITTGSGWGEMSWGEGNYGGAEQVIVILQDGRKRALSSVLQNVVDAWRLARGQSLPAIGMGV